MQPSPFERLLGAAFEQLPAPVRQVHATRAPLRTVGRADVTAATGAMAWLVSWFAGLPKPGRDIATSVVFTPMAKAASIGSGNSPTGVIKARWRLARAATKDF